MIGQSKKSDLIGLYLSLLRHRGKYRFEPSSSEYRAKEAKECRVKSNVKRVRRREKMKNRHAEEERWRFPGRRIAGGDRESPFLGESSRRG